MLAFMCGRFVTAKTEGLGSLFNAEVPEVGVPAQSWNVAPTDLVPVVRERHGKRQVAAVRWGFVSPSAPVFGGGKPIINARIETVATNNLFRNGFRSHRCIVPAAGYYEWQLQAQGKQPFFVHEPDADIAMAGILNAWVDKGKPEDDPGRWRLSMAIITRDAHVAPGEVHDRMPACLTSDSYDDWLGDHLAADDLVRLLDRSSFEVAHELTYYPVSRAVNASGKNKLDRPELVEPLPE